MPANTHTELRGQGHVSSTPTGTAMLSLVENGIGEHPAAQNARASSQRCGTCAHTGILLVLWRALLVLWRALLVLRVSSWPTYHASDTQTRAQSDMLHTSAATVPQMGSFAMRATDHAHAYGCISRAHACEGCEMVGVGEWGMRRSV